jgi:hypothetical protein
MIIMIDVGKLRKVKIDVCKLRKVKIEITTWKVKLEITTCGLQKIYLHTNTELVRTA